MKKSVNTGLIVLLGAGILVVSLLLPKVLLERQRQQAFCEQTAVPVEEVHPYGEEYIPIRSALQKSIRAMETYGREKWNSSYWKENLDSEDDVKTGFEKLQEFIKLWDEDYWSEIEKNGASVESIYVFISEKESNDLMFLPYVSPINEKTTSSNELYFSPEYGIPISGKVVMDRWALQQKSTIPVTDQIWSGLLQAYVQSVGIPFQEKQQSTDVTDDMYTKIQEDVTPEFKSENPKMEQYIYDSCATYAAQSVDGVFELTAVMYEISEDKIGVMFSLNFAN